MITDRARSLWAEEAPPDTGRGGISDGVIITVLVVAAVVEGATADVGWPRLTIPLMALLPVALRWRRSHPVPTAFAVGGTFVALHGAMLIAGVVSTFLDAGVLVVMIYTLARWASGRDAVVGLAALAVGTAVAGSTGLLRTLEGAVALPVFMSLVVLLGLVSRLRAGQDLARLGEARAHERTRIARELHDTVAHHVSAIAVQAQGGQAVLDADPAVARQAFEIIEAEASRTLVEMRDILGALRHDEEAPRTPEPRLADLQQLADAIEAGPRVTLRMAGAVASVRPVVAAAVYRLVQESITNARRHATGATEVLVDVTVTAGEVRLTIRDDGAPASRGAGRRGHGLVGMAERVAALGGQLRVGPGHDTGWDVHAVIPMTQGGQP